MRVSSSAAPSLLAALVVACSAAHSDPAPRLGVSVSSLTGELGAWSQASPGGVVPDGRQFGGMVYDSARGETLLFGGRVGMTVFYGDTWRWNGTSWTAVDTLVRPGANSDFAMVYDGARSEVILFGGMNIFGSQNGTSRWNGTLWTDATPASSPTARLNPQMAFDGARGNVVLFGGQPSSAPTLGDTWLWDGTRWSSVAPATSPSARSAHMMTFDSVRNEVVLFGGRDAASAPLADTWRWNGTTWTQALPATSPPARSNAVMVFDPSRGEALLFGGRGTAATTLSDTWRWDGTNWTLVVTPTAPSPRQGATAAFDVPRKQMLLHGGGTAETWRFTYAGSSCGGAAQCSPPLTCLDGVCCTTASCGTCETCANVARPGTCGPVTNGEDPDSCAASALKACDAAGVCKGALGAVAMRSEDCISGHVFDGVCCASVSCGACESCNNALTGLAPGTCAPTLAGLDPRGDCGDDGSASCGRNGQCAGDRSCQLYAAGTPCSSDGKVCTGSGQCSVPTEASCDGDHTVIAASGLPTDCTPYKCAGATCKTTCASNRDCTSSADCSPDGHCLPFTRVAAVDNGGCSSAPSQNPGGASACVGVFAVLRARRRRRISPPA